MPPLIAQIVSVSISFSYSLGTNDPSRTQQDDRQKKILNFVKKQSQEKK
jgi:hypothetical protein